MDLVLGAASGYTFEQVRVWASSLERSGFAGDKAVVVGNAGRDLVEGLRARGVRVDTRWAVAAGDGYRHADPDYDDEAISVDRFEMYWTFLASPDLPSYRRVILVDTRDVVFQSDPSAWLDRHLDGAPMIAASEGVRYRDEEWNRGSMLEAFGPRLAAHTEGWTIVNAGTLAGEAGLLRDLCCNVHLACGGRRSRYADQAALNLLLGLEPYASLARIDDGRLGWACQAETMVKQAAARELAGATPAARPYLDGEVVRTPQGRPYCLVHQYDRVPEWNARFERLYR